MTLTKQQTSVSRRAFILGTVLAMGLARPVLADATGENSTATHEKKGTQADAHVDSGAVGTPSKQRWYIYRNKTVYGPYTQKRMMQFIEDGLVTGETLINPTRKNEWKRAREVFDVFSPKLPQAPQIQWQPANITIDEAVRIHPSITASKQLAGLGVSLWSAGKLLQVAGIAMIANSVMGDSTGPDGAIVFLVGSAIDVLSPIPAVIGESRANRILMRTSAGGLGERGQMTYSGAYYLTGLVIVAAGALTAFTPAFLAAGWIIAGGDIFFGLANFSALTRIRRFERRNFRGLTVTPQIGNSFVGVSLQSTF
ncbi:MAG: DUF4339 domain-containing protein [Deltaproteobacteria bacterium]|nr:DUF4339 domain-containing protein [Deltaproteobacteria bacterium]